MRLGKCNYPGILRLMRDEIMAQWFGIFCIPFDYSAIIESRFGLGVDRFSRWPTGNGHFLVFVLRDFFVGLEIFKLLTKFFF